MLTVERHPQTGRRARSPCRRPPSSASSTELLPKITAEDHSSRISCQISMEFGTLGTSTVRMAWSANGLVLRVLREVVGVGRRQVGAQRHLARRLQELAVLLLAGRELQHVPRGLLVLAGGVEGDVLGVGERVDLLRAGAADLVGTGTAPQLTSSLVDRDRPRTDDGHRGLACRRTSHRCSFSWGESPSRTSWPRSSSHGLAGRRSRTSPCRPRPAAGRRSRRRTSGRSRTRTGRTRWSATARWRPRRRLLSTILLAGREELVVRRQRRVLRVEAGLLEQVLVVEDHHRVRLPRDLVVLPVRRLVLLGQRRPLRLSM